MANVKDPRRTAAGAAAGVMIVNGRADEEWSRAASHGRMTGTGAISGQIVENRNGLRRQLWA